MTRMRDKIAGIEARREAEISGVMIDDDPGMMTMTTPVAAAGSKVAAGAKPADLFDDPKFARGPVAQPETPRAAQAAGPTPSVAPVAAGSFFNTQVGFMPLWGWLAGIAAVGVGAALYFRKR
jgi:hypothetical protein